MIALFIASCGGGTGVETPVTPDPIEIDYGSGYDKDGNLLEGYPYGWIDMDWDGKDDNTGLTREESLNNPIVWDPDLVDVHTIYIDGEIDGVSNSTLNGLISGVFKRNFISLAKNIEKDVTDEPQCCPNTELRNLILTNNKGNADYLGKLLASVDNAAGILGVKANSSNSLYNVVTSYILEIANSGKLPDGMTPTEFKAIMSAYRAESYVNNLRITDGNQTNSELDGLYAAAGVANADGLTTKFNDMTVSLADSVGIHPNLLKSIFNQIKNVEEYYAYVDDVRTRDVDVTGTNTANLPYRSQSVVDSLYNTMKTNKGAQY